MSQIKANSASCGLLQAIIYGHADVFSKGGSQFIQLEAVYPCLVWIFSNLWTCLPWTATRIIVALR